MTMENVPLLTLKDIDSTYSVNGREQLYLKNVNLTVNAGEVIGIIGRSDSGRSALLRCIGLIDRPATGNISFDNKTLTFLASSELCIARRNIAYVNSNPAFVENKTVADNIALPLLVQGYKNGEEIRKLVDRSLQLVELEQQKACHPQNISNFQKIALDLARRLISNPKILLCDEIFSGLDIRSQEKLYKLIQKLHKELSLTIMITSNEPEIIKNLCHSVIVMHQGMIVERCDIFDLFSHPKSDVAKDFVRFASKHELPSGIKRKIVAHEQPNHHVIVRLNFIECLMPEEILANTIEAYELRMNIIQAYQDSIAERVMNIMILEIYGENKAIADAVNFLSNNGLYSEIIGYVANNN